MYILTNFHQYSEVFQNLIFGDNCVMDCVTDSTTYNVTDCATDCVTDCVTDVGIKNITRPKPEFFLTLLKKSDLINFTLKGCPKKHP